MRPELARIIEEVTKYKSIDKEIIIDALESALLAAAKKKFGQKLDIEAHYNEELGEVELFQFKKVVEKVKDKDFEISLEEARKLDPEVQIGDDLGLKIDSSKLGRISAQMAKQVIIQKVREAEKEIIYSEYLERKHEIANGIVQRIEKDQIVVNLGKTEAVLPIQEKLPQETLKPRDRVRAYILDVKRTQKGPQIILSRTHPQFLVRLFEMEVPEINDGIVKIMGVARDPGSKAKIAVHSTDPEIDPVGACVGIRGYRIRSIVQELRGERIDIVIWDEEPAKFVRNALAPAKVIEITVDDDARTMEIIVPDDQLSLAIGKRGQNVKLASKLTGWKLDIKGKSIAKEPEKGLPKHIYKIEGLNEQEAALLFSKGIFSASELLELSVDELASTLEVDEEKAKEIRDRVEKGIAENSGGNNE